MSRKNLIVLVGLSVLALVGIGLKCGADPPATPGPPVGPDSTYQRSPTAFKVSTTQPQGKAIRYVMDWGDNTIDTTSGSYEPEAEATMYHTWENTGDYSVKAMAILDENTDMASDWSETATITVLPNEPPIPPTIEVPPAAVKNVYAFFWAMTSDPDGDSVGFKFEFKEGTTGDWTDEAIGFVPGNVGILDSHKYATIETVYVKCKARDIHKAESDWCDSLRLVVGTAGAVKWWWWTDDEDQEVAITSVVIAWDEDREMAYTSADDGKIYGIDVNTGRKRQAGSPVCPIEENVFTGHPAYCAQRQHIIIGNEDGELYALKLSSLSKEWHWPGHTREDSLTYIEWGVPAINGDKIYIPSDDDSLYYFTDLGSDGRREAAYYVSGIVDAPVIDINGAVLFGTDSGYLYKMHPDLNTYYWRTLLNANDDIHSPAIGGDGTVYCGTGLNKVFAVNGANGTVKWSASVDGEAYRVVASLSAVFVVTGAGKLYSLNPATGSPNWATQLGYSDIVTSPILAANGNIYCQDFDDIVYCVRQSDGILLWSCDCLEYGPDKARSGSGRDIDFFEGQPAITSKGDIIIVGDAALYCIAGYEDGPLMTAPWPKWQKDHYNTGKAAAW